jgi:outer membrane biogenesis lipoprotein LolB
MSRRHALLSAVALNLLIACSDRAAEHKTVADPHNHVWSDQTRALEKARGVEQAVQDAADRARTDDNPGY